MADQLVNALQQIATSLRGLATRPSDIVLQGQQDAGGETQGHIALSVSNEGQLRISLPVDIFYTQREMQDFIGLLMGATISNTPGSVFQSLLADDAQVFIMMAGY